MLCRIALTLGLVLFAGTAAAEPSSRPVPEPQQFKSLVPIAGAAGGLIGKRAP